MLDAILKRRVFKKCILCYLFVYETCGEWYNWSLSLLCFRWFCWVFNAFQTTDTAQSQYYGPRSLSPVFDHEVLVLVLSLEYSLTSLRKPQWAMRSETWLLVNQSMKTWKFHDDNFETALESIHAEYTDSSVRSNIPPLSCYQHSMPTQHVISVGDVPAELVGSWSSSFAFC